MRWRGEKVSNEITGDWKAEDAALPVQRKPERGLKGVRPGQLPKAWPKSCRVSRTNYTEFCFSAFLRWCTKSTKENRRVRPRAQSQYLSVPSEACVMG